MLECSETIASENASEPALSIPYEYQEYTCSCDNSE